MTIYRRDHFDAEWLLQMHTYHVPPLPQDGLTFSAVRRHGSKWFVADGCTTMAWLGDIAAQKLYTSNINPIRGLDSLILEYWGDVRTSGFCRSCMIWDNGNEPEQPLIHLPVIYLKCKFRIDEWIWPGNGSWQISLLGVSGNGTPPTWSPFQQAVGLVCGGEVGWKPEPHLWLWVRTDEPVVGGEMCDDRSGDYGGWICRLKDYDRPLEIGRVYDLEMLRRVGVDGAVGVWLDGELVSALSRDGISVTHPSPSGGRTVNIGSSMTIGIPLAPIAGAYSKVVIDDFYVSDEYLGLNMPDPQLVKLIVDCDYQIRFYLGNNGPFYTPKTFYLPYGTLPKLFVEPTNFDHFEINGIPMIDDVTYGDNPPTGNYWKEIWNAHPAVEGPPSRENLIGTVCQGGWGAGAVLSVTPPLYADTIIRVIYSQAPTTQRRLRIEAIRNGIMNIPLVVDGSKGQTPFDRNVTEGLHTPEVPYEE